MGTSNEQHAKFLASLSSETDMLGSPRGSSHLVPPPGQLDEEMLAVRAAVAAAEKDELQRLSRLPRNPSAASLQGMRPFPAAQRSIHAEPPFLSECCCAQHSPPGAYAHLHELPRPDMIISGLVMMQAQGRGFKPVSELLHVLISDVLPAVCHMGICIRVTRSW